MGRAGSGPDFLVDGVQFGRQGVAHVDDVTRRGGRLGMASLLEQRLIPPAYAPRRLKDENMIEGWKKKLRAFGQPLD